MNYVDVEVLWYRYLCFAIGEEVEAVDPPLWFDMRLQTMSTLPRLALMDGR